MEVVPGFAVMPSILKEKRFALSAPAGSRAGDPDIASWRRAPREPGGRAGNPRSA